MYCFQELCAVTAVSFLFDATSSSCIASSLSLYLRERYFLLLCLPARYSSLFSDFEYLSLCILTVILMDDCRIEVVKD